MRVDEVEYAESMEGTDEEEHWVVAFRRKISEMIREAIEEHERNFHMVIVSGPPPRRKP